MMLASDRLRWLATAWGGLRSSGAIEFAARVGYASRGVVYLSVGLMAMLKALHATPHADGPVEALGAWAQWPVGVALLWIISLGLCGFAAWRALQSVFDVERLGLGWKALVTRLGKAASGLLYGTLAITVLQLLDTLRDIRKSDDDADAVALVQHTLTLTLPFGRSLVIAFGLVLLAVGLGNMARAFFDHFTGSLACDPQWRRVIGMLARTGYFARGVAFLPGGAFTVLAGWEARPHEAVSIGHGLDKMLSLPFGGLLLAIQAMGLTAFGLFGLTKAVFRRVDLGGDLSRL
jgi:hypothetical protein